MKTRTLRIASTCILFSVFALGVKAQEGGTLPAPKPYEFKTRYSWQEPHSKVLPSGNLEWTPKQFVFEKDASLRYIDFEGGDDSKDGKTQKTAWKHHPWDSEAAGAASACTGIHTYVFKGGVEYKGALVAKESGEPGKPIRLTQDPAWGKGNPVFSGSTTIKGGWKKATAEEAPGIPSPEKVWYIDLGKDYDKDPDASKFSAIWQVKGDRVERLHLARTPDYDVSDPNRPHKNWPCWDKIDAGKSTYYSPMIKKLKGTSAGDLQDVTIWATSPSLMGSAYPRSMNKSNWDLDKGSVKTGAFGNAGNMNKHRTWNFFMIENAATLLDSPGEFFYARKGTHAGRLYLRPAGDASPNNLTFEVAQRKQFIEVTDKSNIVISGLEFRYNDGDDGQNADNTRHNTRASHCILLVGSCSNIIIKNNAFYNIADAIEARLHKRPGVGGSKGAVMDNIIICDNEVRNASGAGVISIVGAHPHPIFPESTEYGHLYYVEVTRNRLVNTGFRSSRVRWDSLPAIAVSYPETCEIAGNFIDTSMGIGIITHGGKASGHVDRTVPLVRYLVHHNQIERTMLDANDYGGLEHFQGGPTYIFNNVSRNTIGNRSFWGHQLGYNLYLDGGFKCYSFNNILPGDIRPDEPDFFGHCGYFMVFGFMDQFFNNTVLHFENGMDGSSGNRSNIVGNLVMDCKNAFFRQNRPGDHSMLGGGDTGAMGRMGIPTMAYDSNVFHGTPKEFGEVAGTKKRGSGGNDTPVVKGNTLEEMQKALEEQKCRLSGVGVHIKQSPIISPAKKDYRPASGSGVEGHGVKYFVPWSVARMVGEWNFYKSETAPNVVLGEGFYMTDEYAGRDMYYYIPRNDLTVSACSAGDYANGELEDWIAGALVFDGTRTASLSQAEIKKDMEYPGAKGSTTKFDGSKRETVDMDDNNFMIEMVFKIAANHTGGSLVAKSTDAAGYALSVEANGGLSLTLRANGAKTSAASKVRINTGKWHHVIAEVDRENSVMRFFVDGRLAGESKLTIAKNAKLSNAADFVVGKGLKGAVDFLRVARSTLAESKTTIDELYTWEFNGPHLSDFTGKKPAGKRSAGAIANTY